MSETRLRAIDPGTPDGDAPQRRDAGACGAAREAIDWNGHGRCELDCGEIVEGGLGLGAFYAYQMAVRSIERD